MPIQCVLLLCVCVCVYMCVYAHVFGGGGAVPLQLIIKFDVISDQIIKKE